ncbi:hypothetical protein CEXT_778821 [Caerostris extrusa]|uniref:Uncharacterized protein n=1 Tax=Caerostris extrusa TaxID=172846 RepID=A0AAV4Y8B3_CAEEX|nr:hypothetical protein CEXT_778821 [Caerostris extrusa]
MLRIPFEGLRLKCFFSLGCTCFLGRIQLDIRPIAKGTTFPLINSQDKIKHASSAIHIRWNAWLLCNVLSLYLKCKCNSLETPLPLTQRIGVSSTPPY